MTASKTANLGLMNPVGSDPFLTTDFAQSMGILDQNPGVLVIPNAASRPSNWNASQHGRMVWQADLTVMWVWVQPSSLSAGSWVRQGNKGWLGTGINRALVSTTAQSLAAAPTVCSTQVMLPGGRPTFIFYDFSYAGNDPVKYATLHVLANGVDICEAQHIGNGWSNAYTANFPYPPGNQSFGFVRPASGAQENINFSIKVRARDPAVVGSLWGGGTSFVANCEINIFEM